VYPGIHTHHCTCISDKLGIAHGERVSTLFVKFVVLVRKSGHGRIRRQTHFKKFGQTLKQRAVDAMQPVCGPSGFQFGRAVVL
jgi:hypothetical protein